MSYYGVGNRSVNSAEGSSFSIITNPTSATLLAEIDLNGTNASVRAGGEAWQVSWICGAQTTMAAFILEHCLSTGLGSTGRRGLVPVTVSSNQSAQFITKHNVEPGDRFRIRVASTFTGNVLCAIIAEPLV